MRGSVRREVTIAVDTAAAWAVVGRPDVLHLWFPDIVDCAVEGDRRTVTLASGLAMDERILTNDPIQRRFQYRVEGGMFTEHLATVDVIGLPDRNCLVTYSSDADPATARALAELRSQLESGRGPALDAVRDLHATSEGAPS